MNRVRKRFDLQGKDPLEVEWRLGTLRQALDARNGRVIETRWVRDDERCMVRVLYEVPLSL